MPPGTINMADHGHDDTTTTTTTTGVTVLRRLARPLLGATFIAAGVDTMRDGDRRSRRVDSLGVGDPQSVTRGIAGAQIGAGTLLVLGRFPRLSSLVLAATVVPDALTGHAFWSEGDKSERTAARQLFVRDLGLFGGLLVSVADTGGRESVPHRARRTARKASRKAAKSLP